MENKGEFLQMHGFLLCAAITGWACFVILLFNYGNLGYECGVAKLQRDRYLGYIWAWRQLSLQDGAVRINLKDLLADPSIETK